jgi:hypothetical protein
MLNEAVTPTLLACLKPPDISAINRLFQSLHSYFITCQTIDGVITSFGLLVVALGFDLTLGALVGFGLQFGVGPEAIQLAAILSFPWTPWAKLSPMFRDTEVFHEIVSKLSSGMVLDNGHFLRDHGIVESHICLLDLQRQDAILLKTLPCGYLNEPSAWYNKDLCARAPWRKSRGTR